MEEWGREYECVHCRGTGGGSLHNTLAACDEHEKTCALNPDASLSVSLSTCPHCGINYYLGNRLVAHLLSFPGGTCPRGPGWVERLGRGYMDMAVRHGTVGRLNCYGKLRRRPEQRQQPPSAAASSDPTTGVADETIQSLSQIPPAERAEVMQQLKVNVLREALSLGGLPRTGHRDVLVRRLSEAIDAAPSSDTAPDSASDMSDSPVSSDGYDGSTHEPPCGETKGGDDGVEAALTETVCACRGRGCLAAHSGRCRELAGSSGRCPSCRLLCACTRSGCIEHPNNIGGSFVRCANVAVDGARRRCTACIFLDRNRNDRRSCMCCRVSRGGVPCGAHRSHPAGECPGIAASGSQYCAACDADRRARRTHCQCRKGSCHLGAAVVLPGQDKEEADETRRAYGAPHEGHVRTRFPRRVDISTIHRGTDDGVMEWRRSIAPWKRSAPDLWGDPGFRSECLRFKRSPLNGGSRVYDEAEADALSLEYRNHCLSVSGSPKVRLPFTISTA